MAKRSKGGGSEGIKSTTDKRMPDFVSDLIVDRENRLNDVVDKIKRELGVKSVDDPRVKEKFPYLETEFAELVKPAIRQLVRLYENPEGDLTEIQISQRHNEYVSVINGFIEKLRKDFDKFWPAPIADHKAVVRPPEETPTPKSKERGGTPEVDANLLETAKRTKKEYDAWIRKINKSGRLTEGQLASLQKPLKELEALCLVLDERLKSPLSVKVVPSDVKNYKALLEHLEQAAREVIEPPPTTAAGKPPTRGQVQRALGSSQPASGPDPEHLEDLGRMRFDPNSMEQRFADDYREFGMRFKGESPKASVDQSGSGMQAKTADLTNPGPYVSPWRAYNERDFHKPGGETESTEKNGGADSEAPAFVPPQFVKQTENEKAAARFESFADVKNEAVRLSGQISKAFAALLAHAEIGKVGQDPELRGLLGEAEKKTDPVLLLRNQITDLENDNTISEEEKRTLGEKSLRQMTTEANDILGLFGALKNDLMEIFQPHHRQKVVWGRLQPDRRLYHRLILLLLSWRV